MNFRRFLPSLTALSVILCAASASDAQAQDTHQGLYLNIGVSQLSADLDLNDLDIQGNALNLGEEKANVTMITGRIGYRLNKFVAIEGDGGFGLGGDNFQRTIPVTINNVGTGNVSADADLDVKNYIGIFARGILPVSDQFDIFIRGGYGTATAEVSALVTTDILPGFAANVSDSQSTNDFAYGIGAEFHITERHGIRADFSAIGSEAQFVSVAYAMKF